MLLVISILSIKDVVSSVTYTQEYVGLSKQTIPQKLIPKKTLSNGDQYGYAVSIGNSKAVVSSVKLVALDDGSLGSGGVVYLFYLRADGSRKWYDSGKTFVTPYGLDGYGTSVAIWDSVLAVGAPGMSMVHVYYETNFASSAELRPHEHSDGEDYFGYSVAVVHGTGHYSDSEAIVVGAYGYSHEHDHHSMGAVFVFAMENYQWHQVGIVQPSRPVGGGYFGFSVAAYGNTIVAGSPGAEAVYLFTLKAHQCPHEGHMPEGCHPEHHRRLQHEHHESQYYWEYREEMEVVGVEGEAKGFGHTVAIFNGTVLTVAVGAVYDSQYSMQQSQTGAVYVFSQIRKGDVYSSWRPTEFLRENHHRSLQEGGEHGHYNERYWPIKQSAYTADKLDNFWMLETTIYGNAAGEKFGSAIAVEYQHCLIGNHPEASGVGRVVLYSRQRTGDTTSGQPIAKGPLYKSLWVQEATLNDRFGNMNDMFGGAVGLNKNIALVGSYLTGFDTSTSVIGPGAAYIYDAVKVTANVEETAATTTDDTATQLGGLMKSLTVFSFSFIMAVVTFGSGFVAYKVTQKKINDGAFDSFYESMGWSRVKKGGVNSLNDIDSSISSQHAMLGGGNDSEHSNSSRSSQYSLPSMAPTPHTSYSTRSVTSNQTPHSSNYGRGPIKTSQVGQPSTSPRESHNRSVPVSTSVRTNSSIPQGGGNHQHVAMGNATGRSSSGERHPGQSGNLSSNQYQPRTNRRMNNMNNL